MNEGLYDARAEGRRTILLSYYLSERAPPSAFLHSIVYPKAPVKDFSGRRPKEGRIRR